MQRHFKWDKKYLYWGITAFLVIAASIVFYMALRYLPAVHVAMKALAKILSPFVWGLVICYLLAPGMKLFERRMFAPFTAALFKKSKKHDGRKLARAMSLILAEILLMAVVGTLVYLILPQLYSSLMTLVVNSDEYITRASEWVQSLFEDMPVLEGYVTDLFSTVNTSLMGWISNTLLPKIGGFVSSLSAGVIYVINGIYNLLIGIIVSVYILSDLERFAAGTKRLMYSIFSVETAEKIHRGLSFVDKTFIGFINGKLLDSAIIGLICYIVCAILDMPYTLLVSVIVGVTNVIPFFGPFIGAIPSGLIILMLDPLKCLIFVVFILILQQVDGNIIGPKILGTSVGINGFWVLFSIIIGAGLFGFWGMLLGVPSFVVINALVSSFMERRLKKSGLPWEAEDYLGVDYIDPVSRNAVKKGEGKPEEDDEG